MKVFQLLIPLNNIVDEVHQGGIKVIFRLLTGSSIKKYKLDTIQFTIFILEDPVIVYGQSCLIAK